MKQLAAAVEYALDIGIQDVDIIRVILEYRSESPVGLFSLDGRPHLKTITVTETDVSAYQTLLMEEVQWPRRKQMSLSAQTQPLKSSSYKLIRLPQAKGAR